MKKLFNNKFKIINVTIILVIIFLMIFLLKTNKTDYNFETEANIVFKTALNDMTAEEKEEYFQNFWEDIYYQKNMKPSNEKFYRRFNRAYKDWSRRAADSQDDLAILAASKPHLLTALFLDYAPDNFNSEISEWAENGDLDNIYINDEEFAYQVCDNYYDANGVSENDQTCISDEDNLYDESYQPKTLTDVLKLLGVELIKEIQKYLDEKDTIRALGRHLFVYEPVCEVYSEASDGTKSVFPYEYPKKYTFDEILELFLEAKATLNFYSIFPEYNDCSGSDSHWLTANGGTAYATAFKINDKVDLCAFYKHLVESDYFEKHAHFKAEFANIKKYTKTDQEYLIEASKLKVGLARQIIDIVDLSNDDDPVYDTSSTAASGANASYSLSKDLYITIGNDRTDSGGNMIKGASYPIDQYVEGVLDAEVLGAFYGTNESTSAIYTALQANAIAIRTYALKVTAEGTKPISNSTANQVFTDKYLDSDSEKYVAARNAALSTTEQVLTENSKLIMSEYSSFSKNTNYRCEGDLCYTSYQKIGSKNSGTLHTVIAKKSWGLAGGHNRGMSQWGSLYLAINGYSYQQILADFYSENVKVANYDYSYKNTDRTTVGEYGVEEAMLVCDLFTSSEFSDIRDLLGDNVTLKIPLRITSTKYQSSGGYAVIDETYNNGISFWRTSALGGTTPGSRSCAWNPEEKALMYRCYRDQSKEGEEWLGYIYGMTEYWKETDEEGNVRYIKDMTFTNGVKNVEYVTDPKDLQPMDISGVPVEHMHDPEWILNYAKTGGVSGGSEASLTFMLGYQYGINLIRSFMGLEWWQPLGTEGGYTAHKDEDYLSKGVDLNRVLPGLDTTDVYGFWRYGKSTVLYDDKDEDGDGITDEVLIRDGKIVYSDNYTLSGLGGRYDPKVTGGYIPEEANELFYTAIPEDESQLLNNNYNDWVYANHLNTILFVYTKDKSTISPELQKIANTLATRGDINGDGVDDSINIFSSTAPNVLQAGSFATLSQSFTGGNWSTYSLQAQPGGVFMNVTELWDYLGYASPGGRAAGEVKELEAHHFDALCNYYYPDEPQPKWHDYCCLGLIADSGVAYKGKKIGWVTNNSSVTNKNYNNFNGEEKTYGQISEALGGYFSDAWKIEFCTETIEGKELVKKACLIALKSQEGCYSQCYATDITDKQIALGYTKDKDGYILDKSGKHIFDYTKSATNQTGSNCLYNVLENGGTGTYTDSNGMVVGTIDIWRKIPYDHGGGKTPESSRTIGACKCEWLLEL